MRFSLIVCTLGRSNELVELFDSLVRQSRNDDIEVIVVDQNLDDRLVDICTRFASQFLLKHIKMSAVGLSRARNVGLDLACGELIGFPDDDCIYLDGYLDIVDRIFTQDASIDGITGHPIADKFKTVDDWSEGRQTLNAITILNRCQEFTVFVRNESRHGLRYNERMGVGAQTLWGADEGPDFLIRFYKLDNKLVYLPNMFVYHPDKLATITRATLARAASYSRGRGCLFRLHQFPRKMIFNSLFRPTAGCLLYLLRLQPMRSAYYFTIVVGTLRGLLLSKAELTDVRDNTRGTETQPPPPSSPPSVNPSTFSRSTST